MRLIGCDSMGIVYHGSKEHGIKRLEPRKSIRQDLCSTHMV